MIYGFVNKEVLALLFLFFGLTIAVIIKYARNKCGWIPYTPTLFLISMGLGITCDSTGLLGESIKQISQINPHSILLIFLPPLIFESSFNSDWYIFRKQSVQIFILAFPAVLVSALLIMFFIKAVIGYEDDTYTYTEAFMFGSVLSCTDTVAVLALLKDAGAPRKFSSLIEGESLLNDGTCMILYTISLELVKGTSPPPLEIGRLFLELTVGAIVLGILFGMVSAWLISKVRNDAVLTLNITVVACYLLYFVAEYVDLGIKISGIMSLVAMGLYMAAFGKTKIAPEATEMVEDFWKTYIFVAETTIFILGGAIVGIQAHSEEFVEVFDSNNLLKLLLLYVCMNAARFLSISVFMPKLRVEGYGLQWKEVLGLTYGGLRGAIGIAFTLILKSNESLNPKFRMVSLLNTSGCAFLTLMINAPTCSWFIKKIGLCTKSDTKIRFFKHFLTFCEESMLSDIKIMKEDKHLENSNWEKVKESAGMNELEKQIESNERSLNVMNENNKDKKQIEMKPLNEKLLVSSDEVINQTKIQRVSISKSDIDCENLSEYRNRYGVTLKAILWEKFENSECSSESIRVLIECVNIDMDSLEVPLNSWEFLVTHLHNPYFFPICYWLKSKPFIGKYAYSWIYDRVRLLYDVISTYIDALEECDLDYRELPYDKDLQEEVIKESIENRKLAEKFLEEEIESSYSEIIERIKVTKKAFSILSHEKNNVKRGLQYGEIEYVFFKKLDEIVEEKIKRLEKDSEIKQPMKDIEILKQCEFFNELSDKELQGLLKIKRDLVIQKDEPIIRSYEKQKFVYLVVRGEVKEEYKEEGKEVYSRTISMYHLSGVGTMLINRRNIEYIASAKSAAALFSFPLSDMRELVKKKPKLEEILQLDIFMVEIFLEPDIKSTLVSSNISESNLKKKKNMIKFKRLANGETCELENVFVVLIFGKILIENEKHIQGCFSIPGTAIIEGSAKFYYASLKILEEEEIRKSVQDSFRGSLSKHSRVSVNNQSYSNNASIIRKTLYTKY